MYKHNRAKIALLIGAVALVLAACNTTPPPAPTYDLTVNVTGNGTVTSDPAGIDTTSDQSVTFAEDAEVTLTATPATGFKFDGWGGDCTGTDACVVTMDGAKTVTATFSEIIVDPVEVTLTVTLLGDGGGTVSSGDSVIACPDTCTGTYFEGDTVTLTTVSDAGSSFLIWGGACSGTGDCELTLTADTDVTALFALDASFSTFSAAIVASADDGEEFVSDVNDTNPAGTTRITSDDLDLTWDTGAGYPAGSVASDQLVGLRFVNVTVPADAVVVSATITFTADATSPDNDVTLIFNGEASVTPEAYVAGQSNNNISSRATTAASASWDAPQFTNNLEYTTSNIGPVVAEILGLEDWASGNAMAFVITAPEGQETFRLAHSFNSGDGSNAPVLTINYYVPPAE